MIFEKSFQCVHCKGKGFTDEYVESGHYGFCLCLTPIMKWKEIKCDQCDGTGKNLFIIYQFDKEIRRFLEFIDSRFTWILHKKCKPIFPILTKKQLQEARLNYIKELFKIEEFDIKKRINIPEYTHNRMRLPVECYSVKIR